MSLDSDECFSYFSKILLVLRFLARSKIVIQGKSSVYILTNRNGNVLYIGSTDDLRKRVYFHKKKLIPGFTKKYNVDKLVYYEVLVDSEAAFTREKQLKGNRRERKDRLVESFNPARIDLWENL